MVAPSTTFAPGPPLRRTLLAGWPVRCMRRRFFRGEMPTRPKPRTKSGPVRPATRAFMDCSLFRRSAAPATLQVSASSRVFPQYVLRSVRTEWPFPSVTSTRNMRRPEGRVWLRRLPPRPGRGDRRRRLRRGRWRRDADAKGQVALLPGAGAGFGRADHRGLAAGGADAGSGGGAEAGVAAATSTPSRPATTTSRPGGGRPAGESRSLYLWRPSG